MGNIAGLGGAGGFACRAALQCWPRVRSSRPCFGWPLSRAKVAPGPANRKCCSPRHRDRGCRAALLRTLRLGSDANHVHLLILPQVCVPVLMRWLKGSTAGEANRILGRSGQPFWQDESWDHYLRNTDQLNRTVAYIEGNPASAGLVGSAERWPWSSAGWQAKPPAPPNPFKLRP